MKFLLTSAEEYETDNISKQLELYDFKVYNYKIHNGKELEDALRSGIKYDLLYLSAHGNEDGFTNEVVDYTSTWRDFGEHIYNSFCLAEENILLLSCCRGGLNKVAYEMFYICDQIEYICGPRISLDSSQMLIGFNIFLFNKEYQGIDPVVATEKILNATDIRFKCFDRIETVTETGYQLHVQMIEKIPVDFNQDGNLDGIIVMEKDKDGLIYSEEDAKEQSTKGNQN
ncbi:hypothetical protein [Aquimarina algiphila]|uniref:hypothetical protein n=1 Tax=Aquimarina algiphila TaxID=2047982 RepID=UPI001ABF7269|nr:hypothetical protein [Aquimarina algiphila]